MSEPTPAPDGAPVTPNPASQQPGDGSPPPDGGGTQDLAFFKTEAKKAFSARDEAKANAQALAAQNKAIQKQIDDLKANAPNVTPADLDKLAEVRAAEAEAERSKALAAGDADAIAETARKPLIEENQKLRQALDEQRSREAALLRDGVLKSAIATSQYEPIAKDVVHDVLKHRVVFEEIGGRMSPIFQDANGNPLYSGTAEGRVTDPQVFVDEYLKSHPQLCKAAAKPGSGASAPGQGSDTPPTAGQKPTSTAEWNSWTPEQKAAANMQPGELSDLAFKKPKGEGIFG